MRLEINYLLDRFGKPRVCLVCRRYYTSTLSDGEADKIKFYFNYTKIASVYPTYTVYVNKDADTSRAMHIHDYVKEAGCPAHQVSDGVDASPN
jgi:hypothetical protein